MKREGSPFIPSQINLPRNLNDLHRHRARIAEEISRTREQIVAVKSQIRELKKIKVDLAAIDRALGLHDIQIDPTDIRPVHNKYKRIDLPYGELSRCVYAALRASHGPTPRRAIFESVAATHPQLASDPQSIKQLKRSIHDRLKTLAAQGRLKRHHSGIGSADGVWSFPDEEPDS